MKDEKNLGADAAEGATARSAESEGARKHTPGPWDDASRYDNISTIRIFAGSYYIATVGGPDDDFSVTDANAHLIAAAPELLAELKMGPHDHECHPSEGRHSERCLRVRALIAKAEGRTP